MTVTLYPRLSKIVKGLLDEVAAIPGDRRPLLDGVASYVRAHRDAGTADLVFICTHNSRRSIMSEIWASLAFAHFDIEGVRCYSGGTETTAFNPRAVAALERAGFVADQKPTSSPDPANPHYLVSYSDNVPAVECFSKLYDDPVNPSSDFAAVMTCSDAERNCPFIAGATRFSLPYDDPRTADGTVHEASRYDERLRQIGTEMLYLAKKVST